MKKIPENPALPAFIDIELWRDFQDGLSTLIEVPLTLYNAQGTVVVESGRVNSVCKRIKLDPRGRSLCNDFYSMAVAEAVETLESHIYKCHTRQYVFTVPVELPDGTVVVVVGGRVYLDDLSADADRRGVDAEFFTAVSPFGFEGDTVERMKRGLKTIPKHSIFNLPGIVENMAAPFLKGLCKPKPGGRVAVKRLGSAAPPEESEEQKGVSGFQALDALYSSIATVLDHDSLYKTILEKSTELMCAERGSLMMLDKKKQFLSIKAAKGIDSNVSRGVKVRVGTGISGSIAAKGQPVMVSDIDSELPSHRRVSTYKTGSFLSIPLKLDKVVIGVLNISDKCSGKAFSKDDLALMLSLANYATIALERGTYYSMSEEFRLISMTDPLTGLFNRRYFRERLFEEMERVKRHGGCFTTFVIDIDNFKAFNDTYGHLAGDDMLKRVSRAIRTAVRGMDIVARYGGEEFNVLLPHTTKAESYVIAERIRESVEALHPTSSAVNELPTISVGIAEFPVDAKSIDELINNADRAMYAAKKMGKNRVVFYER